MALVPCLLFKYYYYWVNVTIVVCGARQNANLHQFAHARVCILINPFMVIGFFSAAAYLLHFFASHMLDMV